jgi:hypothetical protein
MIPVIPGAADCTKGGHENYKTLSIECENAAKCGWTATMVFVRSNAATKATTPVRMQNLEATQLLIQSLRT